VPARVCPAGLTWRRPDRLEVLIVATFSSGDSQGMQVWTKKTTSGKWELLDSPGQGDSKFSVLDYVKQQEVHTQTILAQKHSLMMKQVLAKLTRVIEGVTRHTKHLEDMVAAFQSDPSAGASKVCSSCPPSLLVHCRRCESSWAILKEGKSLHTESHLTTCMHAGSVSAQG
jgi:hypothetical protein